VHILVIIDIMTVVTILQYSVFSAPDYNMRHLVLALGTGDLYFRIMRNTTWMEMFSCNAACCKWSPFSIDKVIDIIPPTSYLGLFS